MELKPDMQRKSESVKARMKRTMFYREIYPDKITDYLPTFFHVPKTGGSTFRSTIDRLMKVKNLDIKMNLLKHTPAKILKAIIECQLPLG